MSRNLHLSVVLSLIASSLFAVEGPKDDRSVTFIKDPRRLPDREWQEELRERPVWQDFLNTHGTWWVEFHEGTRLPHRAYGRPITTNGTDAEDRARNFLLNELGGFALPLADLELLAVHPTARHTYVHFTQRHQGVRVLFAHGMVKLDHLDRVIAFGTDLFAGIDIPLTPAISPSAAMASATVGLAGIQSVEYNGEVGILPVPVFRGVEHRLVMEVTVLTREAEVPGRWLCWVDANTGELLYRQDLVVRHDPPPAAGAEIQLNGTVFTDNPFVPAVTMPMSHARVNVNGTNMNLDDGGYLNTGVTGPVNATISLQGPWGNVRTGGNTPSFTTTLQEGPNTVSFNGNANSRERSAYYHVNVVHDHMKQWLPSFTGMDFSLPTNVDVAGNCNAFYDGSSINFYQAGNDCQSYAEVGEVVYHEYGHGINDKFYQSLGSSFINGAMNEGYADVWALTITQDPVLAEGSSLSDPDRFIRRYDQNRKVYPMDLVGQVHADGEIIAGAWWDTYLLLGNDLNTTMSLFVAAFPGLQAYTPNGNEGQAYRDVLLDVLQADDDDGDITNGTPHVLQIIEGFALHGITLLSNAQLVHAALLDAPKDEPIDMEAQVVLDFGFYPYLQDVSLFYRVNGDPAWNTLGMTNTGGNTYGTSIPEQPAGTVVAYYMAVRDVFGQLSAVTPRGAALDDPSLPNFILVGFQLEKTEDGDLRNELGDWYPGLPSDNATTGQWEFTIPLGSFGTPGDPSTMVQPDHQHTPGGEFCFVTGNATSITSPLGENDVDGGTTTLLSDPIDMSGYANPAITYWRWYVNNPPSGANPNADWWQVYISNNNGATWVPVEDSKTSDRSWRRMAFRVQDHVTPTATMRIKFHASDSIRPGQNLDGGSLVEAAVDDIQLWDLATGGIGMDEIDAASLWSVYPDPASDELFVEHAGDVPWIVRFSVIDAAGRVLMQRQGDVVSRTGREVLDVRALPPGGYVLRIEGAGSLVNRRFQVLR